MLRICAFVMSVVIVEYLDYISISICLEVLSIGNPRCASHCLEIKYQSKL